MFKLPTSPQPIANVLDLGSRLFMQNFFSILPLALGCAVLSGLPHILFPGLHSDDVEVIGAAFADFITALPLFMGLLLILYSAIFYRLHNQIQGIEDDSNLAAIRFGISKLVPVFIATWLYSLLVGMGLLLIVPGIMLLVLLVMFMLPILFEQQGIIDSMRCSYELVRGFWWRTAIVLLMPLSLSILSGLLAASLMAAALGVAPDEYNLMVNLAGVVANSLLNPLLDATLLVQYHDLQIRKQTQFPQRIHKTPIQPQTGTRKDDTFIA